ncbi:hypothetical protein [Leptolyngbya ohadii]|nr:hypothetical protein [Leptolyngbya ohadii]
MKNKLEEQLEEQLEGQLEGQLEERLKGKRARELYPIFCTPSAWKRLY